jgi:MFS family permease
MRDLVPEDRLGAFFSRRLFLATAAGMIAGLLAGAMIARWKSAHPEAAVLVYGALFLLGLAAGLASLWLLMRTPEPPAPRSSSGDILRLLAAPFQDRDFRALVMFLTSWNFAANLVAPFFAIYMLRWLGYDMGFVTMVTVLSQLANLTVTQMWGRFADLYGNRSVLALAVPLFVMSLFLWTFTTAPERHAMTTPLVIVLHLALGVSTAGTTLASSNIALKLAPRGAATTYLAANALATSLAAGVATILGGCLANLFATTELALVLHWGSKGRSVDIAAVDFRRLDFLFLIAFACGLYAVHRLTHVVEPGAAEDQHLRAEILMATRQTVMRTLSSVAGLRGVTTLPFSPRPWRSEAGD